MGTPEDRSGGSVSGRKRRLRYRVDFARQRWHGDAVTVAPCRGLTEARLYFNHAIAALISHRKALSAALVPILVHLGYWDRIERTKSAQ